MIDSYNFGKIIINGKAYNSDVIVFPEKVNNSWWRKQGHNLCLADIKEIINYKPEVLIIGKGKSGIMRVADDVIKAIRDKGIEVFVANTDKAVQKYNEICDRENVVAALHLTC